MTSFMTSAAFSQQVCRHFSRRAAGYNQLAQLQQAIAWRLAHWIRLLPLPPGPCAALGAVPSKGSEHLGSGRTGAHRRARAARTAAWLSASAGMSGDSGAALSCRSVAAPPLTPACRPSK